MLVHCIHSAFPVDLSLDRIIPTHLCHNRNGSVCTFRYESIMSFYHMNGRVLIVGVIYCIAPLFFFSIE
jgi:hypothetical protein